MVLQGICTRRRAIGSFLASVAVVGAILGSISLKNRIQDKNSSANSSSFAPSSVETESTSKILPNIKPVLNADVEDPNTPDGIKTSSDNFTVNDAPFSMFSGNNKQPPASKAVQSFADMATRAAGPLSSYRACLPKNGTELIKAVTGSRCTLIILTRGSRPGQDYKINKIMNVTSLKIIVSNPIDTAVINATRGIHRLFNVYPGATLDIRGVTLYRGASMSYLNGNYLLTTGGAVLCYPGGNFRGSAVFWREPRVTLAGALAAFRRPWVARRTYGGMVLIAGGSFVCYGCMTFRYNPYGSNNINQLTIGGNVLVLAGLYIGVGCYNVGYTPFGAGVNVGGTAAILGGASVHIGGGTEGATFAVGQFGAGQNMFGGGALVLVGFQDISAVGNLMRSGFGQMACGGGVGIFILHMETRVWGTGFVGNAGQTYSVGGGVFAFLTGEVSNAQISIMQAGCGMNAYLGAGNMETNTRADVSFAVTQSQHGLGMRLFNGAGTLDQIVLVSVSTAVVRSQFILAAEAFLGAGFFAVVNTSRFSFQVVNAQFGGHEYWIGPGAAVFIRTYSYTQRVINFRTSIYNWVVAGTFISNNYANPINTDKGVEGFCNTQRGCNFFVNKYGVYKLNKSVADGYYPVYAPVAPSKSAYAPVPIPGAGTKQPKFTNYPTRSPTSTAAAVIQSVGSGSNAANAAVQSANGDAMVASAPSVFPTRRHDADNARQSRDRQRDNIRMHRQTQADDTTEAKSLEEKPAVNLNDMGFTGDFKDFLPIKLKEHTHLNSLNIIQSGAETIKSAPPDPQIFRALFNQHAGRRKLSVNHVKFGHGTHLSPKTYAAIYEMASELTRRRRLEEVSGDMYTPWRSERHLEPAHVDSTGRKYWPEYVYAKNNKDTQCFLCGMSPLPSSSHLTSSETPLDSGWWKVNASTIVPPALGQVLSGASEEYEADDFASSEGTRRHKAVRERRAQAGPGHRRLQGLSNPSTGSACKTSDACANPALGDKLSTSLKAAVAASDVPLNLPPGLEELAELQSGESTPKAPPTSLFWADLTVHCAADSPPGCGISPLAIKNAFKDFVDLSEFEAGSDPNFRISATSADIHRSVQEAVDEIDTEGAFAAMHRRTQKSPQCAQYAKYKLYFVTHDKETSAGILEALKPLSADEDKMVKIMSTEQDRPVTRSKATGNLCGAELSTGQNWFLPATDSPHGISYYQDLYTKGWSLLPDQTADAAANLPSFPQVMLLADDEVAPILNAQSTQDYNIVLRGFLPGSEVVVEMLNGLNGQNPEVIATAKAEDKTADGRYVVPWTASDPTQSSESTGQRAPGRYFLHAYQKNMPGIFAFSIPFNLQSLGDL